MEIGPNNDKFKHLKDWAIQHGAILDNINFPVYYEEIKTFGISARKNIGPYESLLYIPSKIILDSLKIEREELKEFYERNPILVEESYEISLTSLTIFILFEIIKEKDSFWYPYLCLMVPTDLPIVWDSKELYELQDEYFMEEIIDERLEINKFFDIFKKSMIKEAELGLFNEENLNKITIELFINVNSFCQTRNFYATELQSLVVPIADFFNHFETETDFQIYDGKNHVTQHMLEPSTEKYYTMKKINHSSFFVNKFTFLNELYFKQIKTYEEDIYINKLVEKAKISNYDNINYDNDEDSYDENCNNDIINKMVKRISKKKIKKEVEEDEYYEDENDELVFIRDQQIILRDNHYFFISSGENQVYNKDEQIFINYGQYSNEYLIFCYGFCYEQNQHNKAKIRLKFPKLEHDERFFRYLKYLLPKNFIDDYSHYILKFNLVEKVLNMDLIRYTTFCYFFENNTLDSLFTYSFDKDIEINVISRVIEILETYKKKKFERSSLDDDLILLLKTKSSKNCNFRTLITLIYRVANKQILVRQINLFKLLLRILRDDFEIGMTNFYEDLEDKNTFNLNRLIFKQYFKYRTIKL